MSFSTDIQRIAKQDLPRKGLILVQERAAIPAVKTPPINDKKEAIKSPLTVEILTTVTERIYQNNDDTSDNWIDVEKAVTAQIVDVNGKIFAITEFTWP